MSLPPLIRSKKGETLYLYLGISQLAINSVLVRDKDGTQHFIYYVGRALYNAKLRYTPMKKVIFTMDMTTKKLKHYFQAHLVHVLTNQPWSRF